MKIIGMISVTLLHFRTQKSTYNISIFLHIPAFSRFGCLYGSESREEVGLDLVAGDAKVAESF